MCDVGNMRFGPVLIAGPLHNTMRGKITSAHTPPRQRQMQNSAFDVLLSQADRWTTARLSPAPKRAYRPDPQHCFCCENWNACIES